MTLSLKRIYAIFQKDLKDISKNLFVSTTLLMPILLAFIIGKSAEISIDTYYMIINLVFIFVGAFIQCAVIAEEKEKNTLRGLMLSPATIPEILGGKSLVSFILTFFTVIVCSKIMGYAPENMVLILIAIVLSTLFYLSLGTLLGLITRSVVEASVVILPFFLIFGLGSIIFDLVEKYPALFFMEYLPSLQLIDLAEKVQIGLGIIDVWQNLGIITAWFIGTTIITIFIFKSREMDG